MENSRCADRLILFSRYPVAGRAKTRLIPVLGASQAAILQQEMTAHTVHTARCLSARIGARVEIRFDGATVSQMRRWLGGGLRYRAQGEGDLGRRIEGAFEDAFRDGAGRVVVIGCDSPGVDAGLLGRAFAELDQSDLVIGPARDGGYYLIGLRKAVPELFRGIAWGTERVLVETLAEARAVCLRSALLPELDDVDRAEDIPVWDRARRDRSSLAVIIPALNEEQELASTLAAVTAGGPDEVIVVDGGSTDRTIEVARCAGAMVIQSERGRGRQMNAGAKAASSGRLLFLHADTLPPVGYREIVGAILGRPENSAGAFSFAIREPIRQRGLMERAVAVRCRLLGLPYGDQGLFVDRDLFEAIGCFVDWPLLEDVEILRRLKLHGRVVTAREAALTSGRRWLVGGVWSTFWLHQRILWRYCSGVSAERLAQDYRSRGAKREPTKALSSDG